MFVLIYIFSPTLFLRKCVLQGKATFFHDRCKTVAVDSALGSGLCVAKKHFESICHVLANEVAHVGAGCRVHLDSSCTMFCLS